MTRRALKGLKASIKKWEGIVNGDSEESCPLCRLYWNNDCRACPIRRDTGLIQCNATPYDNWDPDSVDASELAQDELDYLKSLLPKGEATCED